MQSRNHIFIMEFGKEKTKRTTKNCSFFLFNELICYGDVNLVAKRRRHTNTPQSSVQFFAFFFYFIALNNNHIRHSNSTKRNEMLCGVFSCYQSCISVYLYIYILLTRMMKKATKCCMQLCNNSICDRNTNSLCLVSCAQVYSIKCLMCVRIPLILYIHANFHSNWSRHSHGSPLVFQWRKKVLDTLTNRRLSADNSAHSRQNERASERKPHKLTNTQHLIWFTNHMACSVPSCHRFKWFIASYSNVDNAKHKYKEAVQLSLEWWHYFFSSIHVSGLLHLIEPF